MDVWSGLWAAHGLSSKLLLIVGKSEPSNARSLVIDMRRPNDDNGRNGLVSILPQSALIELPSVLWWSWVMVFW